MRQSINFGIVTLQHLPWKEEVKRWQLIENLGFDSVWLADHFVNYMQPNASWFESWTLLAALASQTNRIRVGTLVSSIPLRNPAILARSSEGRLAVFDLLMNGSIYLLHEGDHNVTYVENSNIIIMGKNKDENLFTIDEDGNREVIILRIES